MDSVFEKCISNSTTWTSKWRCKTTRGWKKCRVKKSEKKKIQYLKRYSGQHFINIFKSYTKDVRSSNIKKSRYENQTNWLPLQYPAQLALVRFSSMSSLGIADMKILITFNFRHKKPRVMTTSYVFSAKTTSHQLNPFLHQATTYGSLIIVYVETSP